MDEWYRVVQTSKWERSVSYPDITLLRELAAALEVSVTELLAGEREEAPSPVPPEVESVVVDTVAYAETARRKNGGWRWWLFVGLTAGCLIAAMVVCIVNGFRCRYGAEYPILPPGRSASPSRPASAARSSRPPRRRPRTGCGSGP